MNEAMFIRNEPGNEVIENIEKIRRAQNEITDAENLLERAVGNIEFRRESGTYKPVLTVNKKILEECCQKISDNASLIRETYGLLIECGIFEKSRESQLYL